MRTLSIIGIGTGNPDHMTVQAIKALNRADIVVIPRKGAAKDDLAELRRDICHQFLDNKTTRIVEFDLPVRDAGRPSYREGVDDWHQAIAETYRELFGQHTQDGDRVALLVWGDPSLYDSTLRIVERLEAIAGFAFETEVVAGITSVQALAASHRMALNTVGNPVHVTTGRRLAEGFPDNADSAVVMLDGKCAFRSLEGERYDIFWGAYLGTSEEITLSGRLSDVADDIVRVREEARARKGWIMDTYLLRRRTDS